MTAIEKVLGEFIDAWNAGALPELDDYLERVPAEQREELARDVLMWLEIAPTPDYDDATRTRIAADPVLQAALAAGAPGAQPWAGRLRAFRERAGLGMSELAERLGKLVQLPGTEDRLVGYLQQAEAAELDERRVSRRLVDALARSLGVSTDELRPGWGSPALASQHFRVDGEEIDQDVLRRQFDALSRAAASPPPAALDDVDRLFLGGPDA